jgi:hypothetical protein
MSARETELYVYEAPPAQAMWAVGKPDPERGLDVRTLYATRREARAKRRKGERVAQAMITFPIPERKPRGGKR